MLLLALLFCLLSTAFYFRIRSCLHFQCTTYWRRWLRSINFSFVNKCNKAIVFVCLFALAACFIHVLFRPRVHSRATNDHSYSMVFVHIKCTFFFSLHINAFIKNYNVYIRYSYQCTNSIVRLDASTSTGIWSYFDREKNTHNNEICSKRNENEKSGKIGTHKKWETPMRFQWGYWWAFVLLIHSMCSTSITICPPNRLRILWMRCTRSLCYCCLHLSCFALVSVRCGL